MKKHKSQLVNISNITGKAQLLVKCLSVNVSNILIIYNFTRINHSRGRKELLSYFHLQQCSVRTRG